MKKERFFELMNDTDDALIDRAEKYSPPYVNLRAHRIIRWTAVAATLCVIIAACIAVPLAMRSNHKLPVEDPIISNTDETTDETNDETDEGTTESVETDDSKVNDPEDDTPLNPGVYREEDYPDMPATDGLIYKLSPNGDAYYVKGYEGTDSTVYIPATHEGLPVTQIFSWSEGDCLVMTYGAFSENQTIESVFVGKNVEVITSDAFRNCRNLKKIVIPDSVKRIETYAFDGCSSLTDIVISDNVESLGRYTFKGTAYYNDESNWENGVLYVGNHLVKAYDVVGECVVREGTKTIASGAFHSYSYEASNNRLTEIVLPESIEVIPSEAFVNCLSLKKVSAKGDIKSIGSQAFAGCEKLIDIELGDSLEKISDLAFSGTAYYNSSKNWTGGVLYLGKYLLASNDDARGHISIKEGTSTIAGLAFAHNRGIMSVTLPQSLENIGRNAFSDCPKLLEIYNLSSLDIENMEDVDNGSILTNAKDVYTSLDEPTRFVEQDEFVFYCDGENDQYLLMDYTGLDAYLTLPSEINGYDYEIYQYAFYRNDIIKALTVPKGVKLIGKGAFCASDDLQKVTVNGKDLVIDEAAFSDCPVLTELRITSGVKSIGKGAFANCDKLEKVFLAEGLEIIGIEAFKDCKMPDEFIIPDSVTVIGDSAFSGCGFRTVDLPSNIEALNNLLFRDCQALESIVIPDSVKSIGEYAFSECINLTEVIIPEGVETIKVHAFYKCEKLASIVIPDSVTSVEAGVFYACTNLRSVRLSKNTAIISGGMFMDCTSLGKITIPEGVTQIGASAFEGCKYLTEVILPNGLLEIYYSAFSGSGLRCIEIPDSVQTIMSYAFQKCSGLTEVVLGSGLKKIEDMVFYKAKSLKFVYYKGVADQWYAIEGYDNLMLENNIDMYEYSEDPPTTSGNYWHYVDGVPTVWTVE